MQKWCQLLFIFLLKWHRSYNSILVAILPFDIPMMQVRFILLNESKNGSQRWTLTVVCATCMKITSEAWEIEICWNINIYLMVFWPTIYWEPVFRIKWLSNFMLPFSAWLMLCKYYIVWEDYTGKPQKHIVTHSNVYVSFTCRVHRSVIFFGLKIALS